MADTAGSHRAIRRVAIPLTIVGIILGAVTALLGLYVYATAHADFKHHGLLLLGPGLLLTAISFFMYAVIELVTAATESAEQVARRASHALDSLDRIEPLLKTISHNTQLSDAALSIAHRDAEREALRQAIRDEMVRGDHEATLYLINEMERRFGYVEEARKLREEAAQRRSMTIEEKISEAISHIDKLIEEHRWQRAARESDRLLKLFPRHQGVAALPEKIRQRREARKQELLAMWRSAVERQEIEGGIAILTELDQYLTREEAQALADSARHVFKARLLNMGVQFGLAVSENRWRDALEVGLRIKQEFPNTRMAQEVTEKLEILRIRAGYAPDPEVIVRRETSSS